MANWPKPTDLLAALVDPRLEGALCAGKAPMFDDQIEGETDEDRNHRLGAAARICRACPVRTACNTAAAEHQAVGLWSGELHTQTYFHTPRKATA